MLDLNDRPMRHVGRSRRELFDAVEREALAPLPVRPFEYAEWKSSKLHLDYHIEAVSRKWWKFEDGVISG